jgi:hypothetical protein
MCGGGRGSPTVVVISVIASALTAGYLRGEGDDHDDPGQRARKSVTTARIYHDHEIINKSILVSRSDR